MEQNVDAGAPVTPVAPVVENKQKGGNGLKITTAIACIMAICGIGFGVYGIMQSTQKDSQISDLKVQIKEDDGTITTIETPEIETTTNNGTTITINDSLVGYQNQILASQDPNRVYTTYFDSSTYLPTNSVLSIAIVDGDITDCRVGIKTDTGIAYGEAVGGRKCEITGIDKKIYKIVEFGKGQDYSFFNVGFIMEDGTVKYFSLEDALGNNDFNIRKILNIDEYVVDTVDANVTVLPQGGGYRQTMFVLNDGSFVGFDESML